MQKYSSHISLESTFLPFNWEIIVPNYSSWCFLILLLLKTKCSRTKATAVLKVIAQDCWKTISAAVGETKYFSLQTDETTDITVTQQAAIMLRFFDNTQGQVRRIYFALESVERATA